MYQVPASKAIIHITESIDQRLSGTIKIALTAGIICLSVLGIHATAKADILPGQGVTVQPIQSPIAEERFQTQLVSRGLEKLGYKVDPIKELDYSTAFLAVANGDGTFLAMDWIPLHNEFYKAAGGDKKLYRRGTYINNSAQGYLIDKKTADQYHITNIEQLKDPKLARLFDADNDGKADLTGCPPGTGCELAIEHQMDAYHLRDTVKHNQGNYAAMIADTIARFKEGKPILYYTWTPYWVSTVLRPGKDVVWLEVPFSSLPGDQSKIDTQLPNGKNYGFPINTQHIVANKAFADKNPAAAKLFAIMKLPIADINAENNMMRDGQGSSKDIDRHVDGWIKAHQQTFDSWIQEAKKAANP